MIPLPSDPAGATPSIGSAETTAVVEFPQDPRCHLLAVVLLAGYSLRAMNRVRDVVAGGLNGTLILLDILQAEREARAGAPTPAVTIGRASLPRATRSLLAITAAVDVPRETVRRFAATLAAEGWLQAVPQGGYETTVRTRHWFGLDHDVAPYAEFVWTAGQVTAAVTVAPDGVDALVAEHPWQTALATRREAIANPAYQKSMPAVEQAVAAATAGDKRRAAGVVDGYLYRHLKRLRATFEGDLLLPLILGEIAHRNIAALGHHGDSAQRVTRFGTRFGGDAPDLRGEFLPINAYSLSQCMGVPDATMRRKLAHLRLRNWVSIDAEGNVAIEGESVREHSAQCNVDALNDMVACYRRLVAMGMAA
jgi:hypothetical protein